jgi:D-amino-acid dehydrogenase
MAQVVVVGAGVIGLCCAYSLRKRGLDVVVVDGGEPGHAASHGNGGWICPSLSGPVPAPDVRRSSLHWLLQPDSPLYVKVRPDLQFLRWLWAFWRKCNERDYLRGLDAIARLNARTMELFDAMAADGVDFEMHEQGLLLLFRDDAMARKEARDLAWMERYGYPPARWLRGPELRTEEPVVSDAVVAGLLAPAERHVRPESLVRGLVRRLEEGGVAVQSGAAVRGFTRSNGRVSGVQTAKCRLPASYVVLAAGVWTAPLAALVGVRLPLEAGKGYSVTMASGSIAITRPLYCAEARVGLSPYQGAVRVLGTMELSGVNTTLNRRRIAALKAAPRGYLRDWRVAHVQEEWTGLRPLTPDGLPVIGPAPAAENVVIATGHAMLGITLGPATGEAVADIVGGQTDVDLLAPFRADRF